MGVNADTGRISANGHTRLLEARDGWIALSLARDSDRESIPAWLGVDVEVNAEPVTRSDGNPSDLVTSSDELAGVVKTRSTRDLIEQGVLLGLPVSCLGEFTGPALNVVMDPAHPADLADATDLAHVTVLDLSSLWAGPLCSHLLAQAGAFVIKAESEQRPDALRWGRPQLFDELNEHKQHVTFDITKPHELAALLSMADVVVESSRPRALEQLGVIATEVLGADGGPRIWASITGYGRASNRVAFGDDAAVAGGLVDYDDHGRPMFRGDAIADPLTGITAAGAIRRVLAGGSRALLDIALAGVARRVSREGRGAGED